MDKRPTFSDRIVNAFRLKGGLNGLKTIYGCSVLEIADQFERLMLRHQIESLFWPCLIILVTGTLITCIGLLHKLIKFFGYRPTKQAHSGLQRVI